MKIIKGIYFLSLILAACLSPEVRAEGFLHADGKQIVDGNGENVILRGIGTGNWMIMEGYMMKTVGVANTHTQFRNKLIETIGVAKTDSFYNVWLSNHFTRRDVDSMKIWGYNSVRVAMHYKWFTLPIEDEPVQGENTWLDKGFTMIDSLLDWCGDNEMYLILDLHGAPGGQGKDAAISDYDPSKPSLWESNDNKKKTVALWQKLAERYADEPWIGGYDLINETNWTFPEGNNSQLRQLFGEITDSIRKVDQNHILFIEGNSFANDHSGLKPPWDDNMVYSFHKYWSTTGPNDLDWIIQLRNQYNVPLWLGESGENSNTWFTELIQLCESKNIGWSWWPVKKDDINSILNVKTSSAYESLIRYWKGEGPALTEQEAFDAVLDWAENHKIENCVIQYDVIDAMIRQPHTNEVLPYTDHKLTEPVFFTEYDYGKNTIAYSDAVVVNYSMDFSSWNDGWSMRNDGVDIEACSDSEPNNGYNVGWTEDGEWMQYSMHSDSVAMYDLQIRHASGSGGSSVHFEVNGVNVSGSLVLPATGSWDNWQTTTFNDIILPAGDIKIKLVFERGGSNLNYFQFINPRSASDVVFKLISAETTEDGFGILLSVNKNVDIPDVSFNPADFVLLVDDEAVSVDEVNLSGSSDMILVLSVAQGLYSDQNIRLSYTGESVHSGDINLLQFSDEPVLKKMAESKRIPGKIQAEDFFVNHGFELEDCTDTGNGLNTSYANADDYLLYKVHVTRTGYYRVIYRVATEKSNAEIKFQVGPLNIYTTLDTMQFESTGGWQSWDIQTSEVYLEEGYYYLRFLVKQSEFNLNWFQLNYTGTAIDKKELNTGIKLFPNPAKDLISVVFSGSDFENKTIEILHLNGKRLLIAETKNLECQINTESLVAGIYLIRITRDDKQNTLKLSVQK
ncbi:carbohydrate-binding protein [Saccharicrinis sp. FJH2]|uniref:carbohydrate-binding protein n=1 Tax=Saccharicrinis sp. FJH65 TaxID=3344659 RepID=UPI0035F42D9D